MDGLFTIRLPALVTSGEQETDVQTVQEFKLHVADQSDEILLSRISEGDKEALSLLFRRYARIVRGVAYKVLRDPAEADDLLQEIFLLVHRLAKTFDPS